jgi:hypothetical protein
MARPSGGGESKIMGIPTKWALIGAGGAALGLFLFTRKSPGGGGGDSGDGSAYGETLGPHGALALGSLESQLLKQSGLIQEYATARFDDLESSLDEQAAQLGDLGTAFTGVGDYQRSMQQSILGLYRQQLANGRQLGSPEEVAGWSEWLRGKFPAYNLGDLPAGYFGPYDSTPGPG